MSGSNSFKFKKPINWAYAPGISKPGDDGSIGKPGNDGNAIYFIDYELNNSYNIELAQQKLENNYTLSGNSSQINEERKYHSGDIIVSNKGNCYRIEKDNDSYYTFSIKYMGKLSPEIANEFKVKISYLVVFSKPDDSFNNFIPSNRQFLSESENKYTVKYCVDTNIYEISDASRNVFELKGVWYGFLVVLNNDISEIEKYDFSVEIKLKNEKTYNFNSIVNPKYNSKLDPTDNNDLNRIFKFNKILEFAASCMLLSEYEANRSNSINLSENVNFYYVSDMSLDKSHLFGNDVKHLVVHTNGKTYCSKDGYSNMNIVVPTDNVLQTHTLPGKIWPSSPKEIYVPAVYSSYNLTSNASESDINWRGGESAYFSSCSTDTVISKIEDFVRNAEFNIIIRDKNSGKIKIINNMPIVWLPKI